ncbi:protein translocase subunit SecDF [Mycoplasmopsis pulmonis]|uniref:protein translocase subunit SecDF n=1 Tax=Mycoplasmopsis pulmonis TaxID=2107 RepID=UPI002ACED137|nr:protein translocase subunit SecDF [Mycoplasmopsis pulmonis]MDZ7293679.1 protein translocase subunit SecDF [Mycoplasmopsis pulmonis]
MKEFFKKIFSLTNPKRWFIVFLITITTVLSVSIGSSLYVAPNVNKSIDYGGGIESLIQVRNAKGENADENLTSQVSNSLHQRLTGGAGVNGSNVSVEGGGKIRISSTGVSSDDDKKKFEDSIVKKPSLILTDVNSNPIFQDGFFNPNIRLDYSKPEEIEWHRYVAPIKESSARDLPDPSRPGNSIVQIGLKNQDAITEFAKATDYISKSRIPTLLFWLDLKGLVEKGQLAENAADWEASGQRPYNFVFNGNRPFEIDRRVNRLIPNAKRESRLNVSSFLLSEANVRQALNAETFIITGNLTASSAKQLALDVNFGSGDYTLELLSSRFVDATLGTQSFNYAIIAGIISFIVIALIMIYNYGVLGIASSLSIGLYIFLSLTVFTWLNGEYSPATIAALVIAIGMSVDANIITFERIKQQLKYGDSLKKATKNAHRFSLSTILDSNITTLIVSGILFYFGTKLIRGFSISLILSIIFILFVMLIITRMATSLLIGTGFFDNRLYLIGVGRSFFTKEKKIITFFEKLNYFKLSKWFILFFGVFVLIAIIIYSIFAGINGNFLSGFERSLEFQGGTNISFEKSSIDNLSLAEAQEIKNTLVNLKNTANGSENLITSGAQDIFINAKNQARSNYVVSLQTKQVFDQDQINYIIQEVSKTFSNISSTPFIISTNEASSLVKNSIVSISIGIVGIVLYTIFRLKWTFSIAAIVALLHDIVFVIAFFIIFRLEISPIFVAAILSIIGYSINDTIVTFDRIKEIMHSEYYHQKIDQKVLINITNKAIKDTIKRSMLTTITTLVTIVVLLSFRGSTEVNFNIALFVGLISGTYSSIFIASWLFVKLETFRQKMIRRRKANNFWSVGFVEEQTFNGINDFVS